jgi:hypothetical protein
MRRGAQGASLIIAVLLIVTAAAFAVVVAASQSGGGIHAAEANADAIQALFLAEAGLERQLKRFATGTACASLGDDPLTSPAVEATHTVTDLSTLGLGSTAYSITFANGMTTDFSSAAFASTTRCRIPVTATVLASNVTRTIHAIVDRNLLQGPENPTFDNPAAAGAPSGWTFNAANPGVSFADNGGPDGTAPNCSRSLVLVRNIEGGNPSGDDYKAQGTAAVNFTVALASTTTITFFYRVKDRTGAGCAGGGGAGPANICSGSGATNRAWVCFRMLDAAAVPSTSTVLDSPSTATGAVACPDAGTPSAFSPCTSGYSGAPTRASLTMTMLSASDPATITSFIYQLGIRRAGRREVFIDQIEATNDTAIGAARVQQWRDCSTASCP